MQFFGIEWRPGKSSQRTTLAMPPLLQGAVKAGKIWKEILMWNEETSLVRVLSLSLRPFSALCSQCLTATYRPHSVPTMACTSNRHCHWERTGHFKGPQKHIQFYLLHCTRHRNLVYELRYKKGNTLFPLSFRNDLNFFCCPFTPDLA